MNVDWCEQGCDEVDDALGDDQYVRTDLPFLLHVHHDDKHIARNTKDELKTVKDDRVDARRR